MKKIKKQITTSILLMSILLFPVTLLAETASQSPCPCPKKANCSKGNYKSNSQTPFMGKRSEMMKTSLDLTSEQAALLDQLHQSMNNLWEQAHSDDSNATMAEIKNSHKLFKRAMMLFRAETAAPKPDFKAVANKVKSEYSGKNADLYNSVMDAKANFLSSLSQEQLDKMDNIRPGRNNFKRGPGRGYWE